MWPLTVFEASASESSTAVQSVPWESRRSARIVTADACVAFDSRRLPEPGSLSVVVVLNV
jgi:hypothetical protein